MFKILWSLLGIGMVYGAYQALISPVDPHWIPIFVIGFLCSAYMVFQSNWIMKMIIWIVVFWSIKAAVYEMTDLVYPIPSMIGMGCALLSVKLYSRWSYGQRREYA